MKTLRQIEDRILTAVMVVALMVPLILVAVSQSADKPTLSIEGDRIRVMEDGSIQLLFDVCITTTEETPYTTGTAFWLQYNPEYLQPSIYESNAGIEELEPTGPAFYWNRELYQEYNKETGKYEPAYPFEVPTGGGGLLFEHEISLHLYVNGEIDTTKGLGLEKLEAAEGTNGSRNAFDAREKLLLGTLSFRVVDERLLPEIIRKFNGLENRDWYNNHAIGSASDKLIYFETVAETPGNNPWGIGMAVKAKDGRGYQFRTWNEAPTPQGETAKALFSYHFPKTVVSARAAEAELTLNAYQVYTAGHLSGADAAAHVSDIDAALQKYSPAITVTYSDGSQGNLIMPWGRASDAVDKLPWEATVVVDENDTTKRVVTDAVTDAAKQIEYDPTASRYKNPADENEESKDQLYMVTKDLHYYEEYEENGEPKTRPACFPIPIEVKLTVIPVKLIDVTADNLHKSYILNNALVGADEGNTAATVQSVNALKLPTQARLTTDIPVGAVTLTMDIPGWSNEQEHGGETEYWPYTRPSDESGGEAVVSMKDLWKDGADVTTGKYLHWPTKEDASQWDTKEPDESGNYLGANRAGNYTFKMAESYGGQPTNFTQAAIQAVYPWLTVTKDWDIEDATRTIVWNKPKEEGQPDQPKLVDALSYKVEYISTKTVDNNQPELTLQVSRTTGWSTDDPSTSLLKDSIFRIKLPDGTELGWGYEEEDGVVKLDNWFEGTTGSYKAEVTSGTPTAETPRMFNLTTDPGDPEKGGKYSDQLEKLRRYINLGGWYYVSVKEIEKSDDAEGKVERETLWSDFIPVYVPPRDNLYVESKTYNFIGENAGLFPWPGGLSTTVILPPGTYNEMTVDTSAKTYELTTKTENYGLRTTYDGATGGQPYKSGNAYYGLLHTFTIDPAPTPDPADFWRKSGPVAMENAKYTYLPDTINVTTYGPEFFMDSEVYNAYGKVLNLMTNRASNPKAYASGARTATIRMEDPLPKDPDDEELIEKIILEYVSTNGGERSVSYTGENVDTVIYETKTEGYTMRQDYTLVIRNVGNVDINGLRIDTLTDLMSSPDYNKDPNHPDNGGGHFELLTPPASFLPAGESTTFVLTYVYKLEAGSPTMDYKDKLFITSNRKNKGGSSVYTMTPEEKRNYLLDFDAQFQVASGDIHRVFVRVVPDDKCMGDAYVIVGEEDGVLNTTPGTTAFATGADVYVMAVPTDEYEVKSITVVDSTGTKLGDGDIKVTKLPNNVMVYSFKMPDYDTTVTIYFEEPIPSKLRLGDLRVYADASQDGVHNLYNPASNSEEDMETELKEWNDRKSTYLQTPWQKSYTEQELSDAEGHNTGFYGKQLYLATVGKAERPHFDSQVDQYLVVIPFAADYAQVEVDLREVLYVKEWENQPLEGIQVAMFLYEKKDTIPAMEAGGKDIYPAQPGAWIGYHTGETNGPTTHTSQPFPAPAPGKAKYVRVTMTYTDTEHGGAPVSRSYYIEIVRAPEVVDATLYYGNSPYGMIMNDGNIADKEAAKKAFDRNNFSFAGTGAIVPSVVADNHMENIHYWLETWVLPTEKWISPDADWTTTGATVDSEESDAIKSAAVFNDDTGMSKATYEYVLDDKVNLDRNDYAFFAIMGEAFLDPGIAKAKDSSGREVNLAETTVTLSLKEVYTLDWRVNADANDGQWTRFGFPVPASDDPTAQWTQRELAVQAERIIDNFDLVEATTGAIAVSGNRVSADWATWYVTEDGVYTREAAGNTRVYLRPGRYQLAYTFPDYNYLPGDAEYGNNYLTAYRDFVILAPVGDVNADLSLTGTVDETLIENRVSDSRPALGYMADYYDDGAIFKLRTVDVNNDRNINDIDANALLRNSGVKQFYLPEGYKK